MLYVPSVSPESWQSLLADPIKHWVTGYSARSLAHCWQAANGLPPEIEALLGSDAKLLIGIPEHKTPLPGGKRDTQTDLFALLRLADKTCAAAIEGKVRETFGPTVGEWLVDASEGKQTRLSYILDLLGLKTVPDNIRYQLLHRTAAAIESERFKTDEAAMIVHSFEQSKLWFSDFAAFISLFGLNAESEKVITLTLPNGKPLHLAWVTGHADFLAA